METLLPGSIPPNGELFQQTRVNRDVIAPTRKRNTVVSCVHSFCVLARSANCFITPGYYDLSPTTRRTSYVLNSKHIQTRQDLENVFVICLAWFSLVETGSYFHWYNISNAPVVCVIGKIFFHAYSKTFAFCLYQFILDYAFYVLNIPLTD